MQPPKALADRLERLVATAQAEQRSPSLSAAVFRDGEVLWRRALGCADVAAGEDATSGHAYRIGSITKTFTAVCILQLRDAMVLDLDDPLRTHIPEVPGGPTVRDALSHLSGLQREPPGDIWETLQPPTREGLLAGLEDAERVLRPGEAWHYSNLAFGLLGEIVARRNEGGYEAALQARVLEPLGLTRTEIEPSGPHATGYYVDPYSDRVTVEAELPVEGPIAAMGWLWSTVDDLVLWADFLATGRDGVLAVETLDEMSRVQTMADQGRWSLGWGLGLELYRRGDRVFAGHGGAMPGFLAAVCVHRPERTGAAVLFNTGVGARPEALALDLAEASPSVLKPCSSPSGVRTTGRRTTSCRCSDGGGRRARSSSSPGAVGACGSSSWTAPPGGTCRGSRPSRTIAGASSRAASSARSSASPATTRERRRSSTSRRTRSRGRRPRSRTSPPGDPCGRRPRRTRPRPPRRRPAAPRRAPWTPGHPEA